MAGLTKSGKLQGAQKMTLLQFFKITHKIRLLRERPKNRSLKNQSTFGELMTCKRAQNFEQFFFYGTI
jgi:hypothetical protein